MSLAGSGKASDYVAQSCIRYPQLLVELADSGDLQRKYPAGEMAGRLREKLAGVSLEADLHQRLRQIRRREMVRIIWRDLARSATLAETLEDLSALADAVVQQTLDLLYLLGGVMRVAFPGRYPGSSSICWFSVWVSWARVNSIFRRISTSYLPIRNRVRLRERVIFPMNSSSFASASS